VTLGLGLWAGCCLIGLFAGDRRSFVTIAIEICITLIGGALLLADRRTSVTLAERPCRSAARPRAKVHAIVFASMAFLTAAAFAIEAIRHPDGDWDAWAIWTLRARFLFRSGGDMPLAFSSILPHADYPPLLPVLIADVWRIIGHEAIAIPALVAGLFSILTVAVLVTTVSLLRGARWGLLAGIILLGTTQFMRNAEQFTADVPIALFLLTGCALLSVAFETQNRPGPTLALAGLALSLAAFTKNEGQLQIIAGIIALLVFAPGDRKERLRALGWVILGAMPVGMLLVYFKCHLAPENDLVAGTTLSAALRRISDPHRYAIIAGELARNLLQFDRWSLFLIGAIALGIAQFRRRNITPAFRVVGPLILLVILGYGGVYLLSPVDLHWQVSASMDRLLLQLWPAMLLITILQWGD
jgi:4-amino-4-deoxy-L-arabinose transferase-like glycosyltransferase